MGSTRGRYSPHAHDRAQRPPYDSPSRRSAQRDVRLPGMSYDSAEIPVNHDNNVALNVGTFFVYLKNIKWFCIYIINNVCTYVLLVFSSPKCGEYYIFHWTINSSLMYYRCRLPNRKLVASEVIVFSVEIFKIFELSRISKRPKRKLFLFTAFRNGERFLNKIEYDSNNNCSQSVSCRLLEIVLLDYDTHK